MELRSPAFAPGSPIPTRYSCEGEDLSPPLVWRDVPPEAASLVLLCEDPDAPSGTWYHWGVYNLAPDLTELREALPHNGEPAQAVNDFGRSGYCGPCPPPGHGTHHYHFRLLALRVAELDLPARPRCGALARAAESMALAMADLVGTFRR